MWVVCGPYLTLLLRLSRGLGGLLSHNSLGACMGTESKLSGSDSNSVHKPMNKSINRPEPVENVRDETKAAERGFLYHWDFWPGERTCSSTLCRACRLTIRPCGGWDADAAARWPRT